MNIRNPKLIQYLSNDSHIFLVILWQAFYPLIHPIQPKGKVHSYQFFLSSTSTMLLELNATFTCKRLDSGTGDPNKELVYLAHHRFPFETIVYRFLNLCKISNFWGRWKAKKMPYLPEIFWERDLSYFYIFWYSK